MRETLGMGIAFDLDDTLTESSAGMLKRVAAFLGVNEDNLILTDSYVMPVSPRRGEWDALSRQRVGEFIGSEWHRERFNADLDTVPGSPALLRELHAAQMLSGYVTRRPSSLRQVSEQWLRRHGFPPRPLLHAASKPRVCKSSGMALLGARVLVDDHPEEVGSVTQPREQQLGSVLVSRPHNRAAQPATIWSRRASTLDEAAHTATAMLAMLSR